MKEALSLKGAWRVVRIALAFHLLETCLAHVVGPNVISSVGPLAVLDVTMMDMTLGPTEVKTDDEIT